MDLFLKGKGPEKVDFIIHQIKTKVQELELIMSKYFALAELYQLNLKIEEGDDEIHLSGQLASILSKCIHFYNSTNGGFNVAYETEDPEANFPFEIQDDILKRKSEYLFQLDLGGIGKGIALHEVRTILQLHEVRHYIISFGGSSIISKGYDLNPKGWDLAFRSEFGFDKKLVFKDEAASLSSTKSGTISCVKSSCPIEAEVLSSIDSHIHESKFLPFIKVQITFKTSV